jgi:hypothetical protein
VRNIIYANAAYGIRASTANTARNSWSENIIYDNGVAGIIITENANEGIQPPSISHVQDLQVAGVAAPGAMIEIFSDQGGQGRFFEGRTRAGADGRYTFTATAPFRAPNINATATDSAGNSSNFTPKGPRPGARFSIYLPRLQR